MAEKEEYAGKVCVVWYNPDKTTNPQSRYLQALSTDTKPITPLSFEIQDLVDVPALQHGFFVATEEDLLKRIPISSKRTPIIMPLQVAHDLLGWSIFTPAPAPTESTEKSE